MASSHVIHHKTQETTHSTNQRMFLDIINRKKKQLMRIPMKNSILSIIMKKHISKKNQLHIVILYKNLIRKSNP